MANLRAHRETLQRMTKLESHRLDQAEALRWNSLRLFLIYRIVIAMGLLYLFYSGSGPDFLGQTIPELFGFVATLYVALTILSALFWHWRMPEPEPQAYLILFVDITAITLMMHSSGGVQSGIGMLIAVSITGGALIMGGRAALLFAA
ncbi:MAG: histidine kinase, partial [Candidatus Thiodiazotropha sp.]